jgi:hypothetical protein
VKVFRAAAFVLLSLVGMAGMTHQAIGQVAPGRSGMSTETRLENVRAFRDLSRFGRCYVDRHRDRALSLIATTPGTPEEEQIFRRLIRGDQYCLHPGTTVNLSVIYFRGVIAEGLLRSDAGVPASHRLPAPTVAEVRSLGDVARCYASGHRVQVQNLLATEAGSPEELAAVQSLWNDFRSCLPPDARIRLNATWIRFLLAEALLRLAPDAAAPAAGS